jgi:hypothetical protein
METRSVDKGWGQGKIFVSIASYRDPECQHTIKDLFEKAAHPERVFIGLCLQYDKEEDKHCFRVPNPRPENVRELHYDWRDAQGVCWARWLAMSLWRGEEFFLQIDSHMRFVPNWDTEMIAELEACPSAKPVVSCCIARYTPPDELDPNPKPSVLRSGVFTNEGNNRNRGAFLRRLPEEPLNAAFISAGFLFARGELIEEVPYDPYLYFDQEEITYALRLYTHGYDVFSSRRPFTYHYYIKVADQPRPLSWMDARSAEGAKKRYLFLRDRGLKRMNHLTAYRPGESDDITKDIDLFGLGAARSLRDYENYCGIDFKTKRVSEYALRARFIPNLLEYVSGIFVPELDGKDAVSPVLMGEEERLSRLREAGNASPLCPEAAL